jgi:hypothetical protein
VEDRVGFRAERAKDFCGGDVRGDILRQDRHERGLGIGDGRKGSVLWGIRAGRACGRAAARHGDRGGQPFRTALRTASFGRRGRLRRSAGRRQIPTRKHQVPTDFFAEIPQILGIFRLRVVFRLTRRP